MWQREGTPESGAGDLVEQEGMLHFNTSKEVWCQATKEHEQAKWELNRDGDKDHLSFLKIRIS